MASRVWGKLERYLADLLSLIGGIYFAIQLWTFTHTRESVLDEGAYMLKGFLFASGQYKPYQDYGPWTNHMPLAFLIPGFIQKIFGPGLESGRYFAAILSILMLLGLWLLVRRLGGHWWATAVVWIVAWNPALVKTFSLAVSQSLIACMMVWILFLTIGADRPDWQIYLGSVLTGMMILVRINMLPVLPILCLYVLWERGIKNALVAGLAGCLTLAAGHALFWPGILHLWAYWLPREITPFLDNFRLPQGYIRLWDPHITAMDRLLSVLQSIRLHFVAIVGVLSVWLFWPKRSEWKSRGAFRSAVFLSLLFIALTLLHAWATLAKNYCVYCLPGYVAFYSTIGFVLVVITFSVWHDSQPLWKQIVVVILILGISVGIGLAAFEDIGSQLLTLRFPGMLLDPRGYSFIDFIPLEKILSRRFDLDFPDQRRLVPAVAGGLAGLLILGSTVLIYYLYRTRIKPQSPHSFAYWITIIFILVGFGLSPAKFLAGGKAAYDCEGDTLESYKTAGNHLAQLIAPGSRVYWRGGLSVAPLLYVPNIRIYPPQINGDYSYYIGGDPDALLKFGFWNLELDRQWIQEADYVLVQESYYKEWKEIAGNLEGFEELTPSPPTVLCEPGTAIHIFKRSP